MDISRKDDNLKAIEELHPDIFEIINNYFSEPSSLYLKTEKSRSGEPALSGLTKEGTRIYLHSKYDPVKESGKIIAAWNLKKTDSDILILGFSLGYLPLAMANELAPSKNLYIIEPSIEVFLCGIEHINLSALLNRSNTKFFIGPGFLSKLKNRFSKTDFKTVFFAHQPSLQLFPELNEAESYMEQVTLPKLKEELNYSKFKSKPPKILLFEPGFFIEKELKNTFTRSGFSCRTLKIDPGKKEGQADFIHSFMEVLAEFKPDFIFTTNLWGFDREEKLVEILTHFEIPFVCWFVDNPLPLLARKSNNASEFGLYLLWDHHYIREMETLSFPNVEYLPYGVDSTVFYVHSHRGSKKYTLSFVGSSLKNIIQARLEEISKENTLVEIYNKLTENPPPFSNHSKTIDLIKRPRGHNQIELPLWRTNEKTSPKNEFLQSNSIKKEIGKKKLRTKTLPPLRLLLIQSGHNREG